MLLLIGMRGSGKTTIGARLAAVFDRPFIDLDREMERTSGRDVATLFHESVPAFRELEHRLLAEIVHTGDPRTVLATGGGAPTHPPSEPLFRRAVVLYLWVPVELLQKRLASEKASRPSITGGDPVSEVPIIYESRRELYERLANLKVDASGDLDSVIATLQSIRGSIDALDAARRP